MINKIKSSNPIDNFEEIDHYGFKEKSDFIADLLNKDTENKDNSVFEGNNMVAIYGEWGSGKTSLMKNISKQLDDKYKVVFFEAWKYEKGDGLNTSLLSCILDNIGIKDESITKSLRYINNYIKDNWTAPIFYLIKKYTKIDLKELAHEMNIGEVLGKINNEFSEYDSSFYNKIKKFEEDLKSIVETKLPKKLGGKKLLVFIDDLDRCEPKHVLDLLSDIKLFFSFSKDIVYFCGIDKCAVSQAIETVYGNVIKSNEYLEKIFTLSFNMPKVYTVKKVIESYFDKNDKNNQNNQRRIEDITNFFKLLKFDRPRHIKKVLNKYMFIKYIQDKKLDKDGYIPPLDNIFYEKIVIYTIMLYELYPHLYEDSINNSTSKYDSYIRAEAEKEGSSLTSIMKSYGEYRRNKNIENSKKDYKKILRLILFFTPTYQYKFFNIGINTCSTTPQGNSTLKMNFNNFIEQFETKDNRLIVNFCLTIFDSYFSESNIIEEVKYELQNIRKMVDKYF
ncbi:MAG: KAP family NTPase [Peptostreptococcaceae bacterium]|jgi:energy-coupling factor transporter ATP-binding protein EcfA2|nr:KAP family NTPase [Peptostreptococcaceae bacterium]